MEKYLVIILAVIPFIVGCAEEKESNISANTRIRELKLYENGDSVLVFRSLRYNDEIINKYYSPKTRKLILVEIDDSAKTRTVSCSIFCENAEFGKYLFDEYCEQCHSRISGEFISAPSIYGYEDSLLTRFIDIQRTDTIHLHKLDSIELKCIQMYLKAW